MVATYAPKAQVVVVYRSPGGRSKVKHWESCVAYGGGRVWMRSRRNVELLGVDGL